MKFQLQIFLLLICKVVLSKAYVFRRSFQDFNTKSLYNINKENNLLTIVDNDTLIFYDLESSKINEFYLN